MAHENCEFDLGDYFFQERYLDALFADHEKGHPDHEGPVVDCPDCVNVQLTKETNAAIRNAERLARGE